MYLGGLERTKLQKMDEEHGGGCTGGAPGQALFK